MEFNDGRVRHLTLSLNPTSVMLHAAFEEGGGGFWKLMSSLNLLKGATRPFLNFVQSRGSHWKCCYALLLRNGPIIAWPGNRQNTKASTNSGYRLRKCGSRTLCCTISKLVSLHKIRLCMGRLSCLMLWEIKIEKGCCLQSTFKTIIFRTKLGIYFFAS